MVSWGIWGGEVRGRWFAGNWIKCPGPGLTTPKGDSDRGGRLYLPSGIVAQSWNRAAFRALEFISENPAC